MTSLKKFGRLLVRRYTDPNQTRHMPLWIYSYTLLAISIRVFLNMLLRIKKLEKKSSLILHDGRRHDDELIGFISLCFFFQKKKSVHHA